MKTPQMHPVCTRCYKHLIGAEEQWKDLFPLAPYHGVQRFCCFCEKPTQGLCLTGELGQCGVPHS